MADIDIDELVERLRITGGDTASCEVKLGAGGFPGTVIESLSGLANLPGGGTLIVGLDESDGFSPVNLPDVQGYMQTLGQKARLLQPPPHLEINPVTFESKKVIVAVVRECDPSSKPCRIASSGKAYVRSHDGDFEISAMEEQGFLRERASPMCDREAVECTSVDDLDTELTQRWQETVRRRDEQGLGRFDAEELLRRAGITIRDGRLTKAGLLALGKHPQEFFPRAVVHVADLRTTSENERARNIRSFSGPIPVMLSETMKWLANNLGTKTVQTPQGGLKDEPEYPLVALRELVANALVHRDLDTWSQGRAIELRLRPGRFELINPGGLYGVTVDRLGEVEVTSARNQRLVSICENVTDLAGQRVVEAIASGLTTVRHELMVADLPPARYFDTAIAFTVVLTSATVPAHPQSSISKALPAQGTNLRQILDAVLAAPGSSLNQLAASTNMSPPAVRTALSALRSQRWRLVTANGGRGRATTYAPSMEHRGTATLSS